MSTRQPIGELNGRWALLLKVNLIAVPVLLSVVITWATWVTTRVFAVDTWQATATATHATKADLATATATQVSFRDLRSVEDSVRAIQGDVAIIKRDIADLKARE